MTKMYLTLIVLAVFVGGLSILVAQDNGISISIETEEQQEEVVQTATDSAVVLQPTNPEPPTTEGYIPQPPQVQQPEPPVEVVETEPIPDTEEVAPEPITTTPPVVEVKPEPEIQKVAEPPQRDSTIKEFIQPEPQKEQEPILTRETEPVAEPEKVVEPTEPSAIIMYGNRCIGDCGKYTNIHIYIDKQKIQITLNGGVSVSYPTNTFSIKYSPNENKIVWGGFTQDRSVVVLGQKEQARVFIDDIDVRFATHSLLIETPQGNKWVVDKDNIQNIPTGQNTNTNTSDNGNNTDVITPIDTGDNSGDTQTIGNGSAYKTSRVERTYIDGYVYGRYQNKFYRKSSYGGITKEHECTYTKDISQDTHNVVVSAFHYFTTIFETPNDVCVIFLGNAEYNAFINDYRTIGALNTGRYYQSLNVMIVRDRTHKGSIGVLETIETMYHELIHAWQDKQIVKEGWGSLSDWYKTKAGSEFVRIVGFYNNNGEWGINNLLYKSVYGGGLHLISPIELSAELLAVLSLAMFVDEVMKDMPQYTTSDLKYYYSLVAQNNGISSKSYTDAVLDWAVKYMVEV